MTIALEIRGVGRSYYVYHEGQQMAGQIAVRAADAITAERLARQKVADGLVHFDRTEAVELTGLVVLDGAGGAAR